MIPRAEIINPVNYPQYLPELKIPEYKSLDCVCLDPCGIHEENQLVLEEYSSDHPIKRGDDQLDNFKKLVKAYDGRDSNAVKYVKKVEAFIDKPLDELELKDIREIMNEVKLRAN